MKILFEACVDSVESSVNAEAGGADRIELCADLLEGGITPSYAMIKLVPEKLKIPVNVIIRPRGGDFLYTDYEFEVMKKDIEFCKQAGVNGVVIGILNDDGTIDKTRTKELIEAAKPMSVTFHRAFDMTRDPEEALNTLIELGIDQLLTSGQEVDARKGIPTLKKLVELANNRIIIMPGGGVNEFNIKEVVEKTGVKEIHASAREKARSKMNYINTRTSMSDSKSMEEYDLMVTSEERIRAMVNAIKR
ncbi:MAG: copper homeostasis protein cutC [Stygiobacter sp.]|nr:MAG: copper homeostasis protein cutC [Stygiobacter sp.]KAF0217684.1 MAG: copper homeostasis protein [Ignavibacteria bacterium]